ncbi:glycosyl hydrolase [Agromyces rhizosphaerae]|uniref:Glycosyl hydrolase n=1 Tax=Agromyces rhizosphaerae TaxID=88374 RepID=A0A9W6CRB2_9MICO|nr:glycoside hydrolase family 3 C-terminal domain-containing protein [Agromyces rhizosphaerae]GLI27431.1 glycosyl hydrolase [Agromyces rhizosphaerae]
MSIEADRRLALNDFAGAGLTPFAYADGPCGIRGAAGATALPSTITLAASFDPSLAERYGDLLGTELRAAGCNVLVGPAFDVVRDPYGGRNGECLGEDPLLVGELGGRIARGVHAHRALTVAKHYVAYDRESLRTGDGPYEQRTDARDMRVDARTLHEVHLEPFRRAVQDHGVAMLLACYIRVNGVYSAQSEELLQLPRREWGFTGATLPDFLFAVRDARAALAAGLDLPALALAGPPPLSERTEEMVASAPDALVAGIGDHVRAAAAQVALEPAGAVDPSLLGTPAALALAERIAVDGATLLRNEGVLPFAPGTRIALIGGEQVRHRLTVAGSAGVALVDERLPDLEERLADEGLRVAARAGGLPDVPVAALTADDCVGLWAVVTDASGTREVELDVARLAADPDDAGRPWNAELTAVLPPQLGAAVAVVEFAGVAEVLLDGEVVASGVREASPLLEGPAFTLRAGLPASDRERTLVVRYRTGPAFALAEIGMVPHLSLGVVALEPALRAVSAAASGADAVVVLAGRVTGAGMDADGLRLPVGQGDLIAAAAGSGRPVVVVTHGAGPIDMPWRRSVAAILHVGHGGERFAPALARVLSGSAEPGGRLPVTFPDRALPVPRAAIDEDGGLEPTEGVDVGYRSYERAGVAPAYWFGHGLGYARIDCPAARVAGRRVQVDLECGPERGGKAVVQLYARPAHGETLKLAGFGVARLDAGEQRTLEIEVDAAALAMRSGDAMVPPSGVVPVHVGFSRGDLRRVVEVDLG